VLRRRRAHGDAVGLAESRDHEHGELARAHAVGDRAGARTSRQYRVAEVADRNAGVAVMLRKDRLRTLET
jgi:hypothetical protein